MEGLGQGHTRNHLGRSAAQGYHRHLVFPVTGVQHCGELGVATEGDLHGKITQSHMASHRVQFPLVGQLHFAGGEQAGQHRGLWGNALVRNLQGH